ncbi:MULTISPECIES: ribosome silencing factor [Wolbachia]|jgi:ribosome-associated protein|uniref:Ribosomal silencing factor RsfS n=1 Tax=Wolbachia pipientis TaxID=955 RepID=A0A6I6CVS0_WOLPI|nr:MULTISPECIES: ribosome silencing factor [Wolbachia]AOV87778.1 Iojap-related protein [Wolbachia endosymbiont of Drosophila incompta]MDX5496753.1 ribosome silencing factor [Wolbachia endosymbiont of Nomada fabriciana]MDX5497975.1 ribosome silencing factor [Wolbachia endosymbiont of Lasioglossum nitidulum]MDX5507748.1 ribosome silencing factor [Wolbachia endosymbiont of Hylaeus sinuatus]MDX5510224.1 ribosome silencing factor [Wolbachia endosymbiont of Lasioglossum morio]MDX5528313.1 ribosome 
MLSDMESIRSTIEEIIDQNKGHDIVTFDVQNKTVIAKYMIIASGDSSRHVKALAEHVIKSLKPHDKIDVEGMDEGNWVVLNFQGIMVHIFRPEVREYYKIEELWN